MECFRQSSPEKAQRTAFEKLKFIYLNVLLLKMAIKDWKKVVNTENKILWRKGGKPPYGTEVQIAYLKQYNYWTMHTFGDMGLIGEKRHFYKRFKSKASALRFAKAYMRSH